MSHEDAAIYRDAAQIIREGGLSKGCYGPRTVRAVPHCTAGAVRAAAGSAWMSEMPLLLLADLLGRQGDQAPRILNTIADWNDQPDRTAADVILLLEQAAEKAEADQ